MAKVCHYFEDAQYCESQNYWPTAIIYQQVFISKNELSDGGSIEPNQTIKFDTGDTIII
jgi:hypothetical protein